MSEIKRSEQGVPQGSVIGPLLFLMYINDINYFISPIKCVLFADDTTLIISHKNFAHCQPHSREKFTVNKLKLNNNKTEKLFIFSNHIHTQGNKVKLLGIVLNDNLNWSGHLQYLSKSLPSTIFLIRVKFCSR